MASSDEPQDLTLPELARTTVLKSIPGKDTITAMLHLRRRREMFAEDEFQELGPGEFENLDVEQFEALYSIPPEDLERIKEFAKNRGLEVVNVDPVARMVDLKGAVTQLNDAFGIVLEERQDITGRHRAFNGSLRLPPEIEDLVEAVTGLEDRSTIARVRGVRELGTAVLDSDEAQPPMGAQPPMDVPSPTDGPPTNAIEAPPSFAAPMPDLDEPPTAQPNELAAPEMRQISADASAAEAPAAEVEHVPIRTVPERTYAVRAPWAPPTAFPARRADQLLTPLIRKRPKLGGKTVTVSPTRRIPLGDLQPPGMRHSYFADEIAKLYNFPKNLTGEGQTVGILAFRGGYNQQDLEEFCQLRGLRMPKITVVPHGRVKPDDSIFSLELTADLQVVIGAAPGADIVIYYFDSSTPQSYMRALKSAIYDRQNRPSVISISYGNTERHFLSNDLLHLNEVFRDAARLGITVCVATGDGGSASSEWQEFNLPAAHVNYPAICPYALACGGSSLETEDGKIKFEGVFNYLNQCVVATGGGVSEVFSKPEYQSELEIHNVNPDAPSGGRGIPDVAANAEPETGYSMIFQGELVQGQGGTSYAAPLWAALIARLNQGLSRFLSRECRVGFINPYLYRLKDSDALRPIVTGTNGAYDAGPGWNPCTGLGTPDGTKLLERLIELHKKADFGVVAERIRALNGHKMENLLKCHSEDVELEDGRGNVLKGKAGIETFYRPWFESVRGVRLVVTREVVIGAWVLEYVHYYFYERDAGWNSTESPLGQAVLNLHQIKNKQIRRTVFLQPPPRPATMNEVGGDTSYEDEVRNADLIRRQLEAYNAQKLDDFVDCFDEDAVVHLDDAGLELKGRSEIRETYRRAFESDPNVKSEVLVQFAAANWIVQKLKVSGLSGNDSKKKFESLAMYQVRDDRIRKLHLLSTEMQTHGDAAPLPPRPPLPTPPLLPPPPLFPPRPVSPVGPALPPHTSLPPILPGPSPFVPAHLGSLVAAAHAAAGRAVLAANSGPRLPPLS